MSEPATRCELCGTTSSDLVCRACLAGTLPPAVSAPYECAPCARWVLGLDEPCPVHDGESFSLPAAPRSTT